MKSTSMASLQLSDSIVSSRIRRISHRWIDCFIHLRIPRTHTAQITTALHHTCALEIGTNDVRCWGQNNDDQAPDRVQGPFISVRPVCAKYSHHDPQCDTRCTCCSDMQRSVEVQDLRRKQAHQHCIRRIEYVYSSYRLELPRRLQQDPITHVQ